MTHQKECFQNPMFFHYLKHTQHQPIRLFAGFFSALQFFFSSLSFDLSFVIALNKQPFRAIESCAICNWSLGWNVNLILILYAIGNKHVNQRAPLWFTTHRNRLIVCVRPGFFYHICSRLMRSIYDMENDWVRGENEHYSGINFTKIHLNAWIWNRK